jgi:hypothetical protein
MWSTRWRLGGQTVGDWGSKDVAIRHRTITHIHRLLASRSTPVNFGGSVNLLLGFPSLASVPVFKALETRPSSHSHLLHIPLCIAPGPPRGG